jgi:hypothetical protein
MPDEIDALVKFSAGWAQDGTGEDGLPLYRETVNITLAKPPYTRVDREATEDDQENFPGPWKLFQKSAEARKADVEGYPLALWAAIDPAEFQMCVARDIYTVEQLAAKTSTDKMPPPIRELVERAKKMIALQKDVGRFEVKIRDLQQQNEALQAELAEARSTISAQNTMIDKLQKKAA